MIIFQNPTSMIKTYCNYISKIDRSKSSSKLEQSFLFFFKNVQTDLDSKQERKKERIPTCAFKRLDSKILKKELAKTQIFFKNTHTHTHTHTHNTLHSLLAAYLPISSSAVESIIYCRSMI